MAAAEVEEEQRLGAGSYGKVVPLSPRECVKRFFPDEDSEGIPPCVLAESTVTGRYPDDSCLINGKIVYNEMSKGVQYEIVMERGEGDLEILLASPIEDRYGMTPSILCQLLLAMQALHGNNTLHRDIKPSNIIIMKGLEVRLADFGLSVVQISEETPTTIKWSSSVMYDGENEAYTKGTDMGMVGATMATLLIGKYSDIRELSDAISRIDVPAIDDKKYPFSYKIRTCIELIKDMLIKDQRKRPTADEAINRLLGYPLPTGNIEILNDPPVSKHGDRIFVGCMVTDFFEYLCLHYGFGRVMEQGLREYAHQTIDATLDIVSNQQYYKKIPYAAAVSHMCIKAFVDKPVEASEVYVMLTRDSGRKYTMAARLHMMALEKDIFRALSFKFPYKVRPLIG